MLQEEQESYGFDHVEVLQEPVAASMAYGLDSKKKDGFWLALTLVVEL
ncbi:MAG: hypothetical protein R2795_14555 [Saprospiraceae bacterium]